MRTDRTLVRFAVALSLLAATTSCHDSAKPATPQPSSSAPSPQARAATVTPAAPTTVAPAKALPAPHAVPPAPPLDTMVPVKTFEIHPPAAFTEDQLPRDQAVEFLFDGTSGQMLRVKGVYPYRVRIQPPGNLRLLDFGGDSTGNWFYALPVSGAYRVLYAPWQVTPSIQFDFLPDNDPRADPGIKPDQVVVDFGAFAGNQDLVTTPLSFNEDSEDYWESWPTHLAVVKRDFEFRIMTVAGNKAFFKDHERITALEAALRVQGKNADVSKLPYPVYAGGGLNFWTKPTFVEGDGWRGLRWIASYGQDIGCWFDPSAYVFQAISNDGRYYVLLRVAIVGPSVTAPIIQDCEAAAKKNPNIVVDKPFDRHMSDMLDKAVAAADPASFQPNLDQLDAVVRSLKLKQ